MNKQKYRQSSYGTSKEEYHLAEKALGREGQYLTFKLRTGRIWVVWIRDKDLG